MPGTIEDLVSAGHKIRKAEAAAQEASRRVAEQIASAMAPAAAQGAAEAQPGPSQP